MMAGSFLEVLARRRDFARPKGVVPSAPEDPFARRCSLHTFGDTRLHLCQRLRADKIDVEFFESAAGKVRVGVIEAGNDEMAAEVDERGVGTLVELFEIDVRANADDFAPRNGNRG